MPDSSAARRLETCSEIIENTTRVFADPTVVESVGEPYITMLQSLARRLVVVEVEDGVNYLPESADNDDAVPLLAVLPGEKIKLDHAFSYQTSVQRQRTGEIFESWGPKSKTGEEHATRLHDLYAEAKRTTPDAFYLPRTVGAYVCESNGLFLTDPAEFDNLPPGFFVYSARPLLTVVMNGKRAPDVLAHELTHFNDRLVNPVHAYDSQESIDMDIFRQELEAYHVGALVRTGMESGQRPHVPYRVSDEQYNRLMQVAIDNIRVRNNKGAADPFRATPKLLREIKSFIGVSLLHHELKYNEAMAKLTENASFDV